MGKSKHPSHSQHKCAYKEKWTDGKPASEESQDESAQSDYSTYNAAITATHAAQRKRSCRSQAVWPSIARKWCADAEKPYAGRKAVQSAATRKWCAAAKYDAEHVQASWPARLHAIT